MKTLCVAILFFSLCVLSGCIDQPKEPTGENFTFIDLEGNNRTLSEFYGRIIIVDFMAVNCQPCMAQMFELKKISENYSNEVNIISIDAWISLGETASLVQQYIAAFKEQVNIDLNWTFGVDDRSGTLMNKYAKNAVPTLYILDKKGNIYYSHVGYETSQVLAAKIDEKLGNTT